MLLIRSMIFLIGVLATMGGEAWQKPGCHKVGNTRRISIPDCVEFTITTNACRGYCESYAVPAIPWGLLATIKNVKPVVSIGQCCNIMDSEDVKVRVSCIDGTRILTFKSALECSCYHCKKD